MQTPEVALRWSECRLNLRVVCRLRRLQNAPSRMAVTNANTAHTASTSSRKATSTARLPVSSWANFSKAQERPEAANVLRCNTRARATGARAVLAVKRLIFRRKTPAALVFDIEKNCAGIPDRLDGSRKQTAHGFGTRRIWRAITSG